MSRSEIATTASVLALGVGLVTGCAPPPLVHGEVSHPTTRDGWPLTVERFRPSSSGTIPRKKRPVVLCHGLLSNRAYFKLDGPRSLPLVLAREGFDVYVVDLRGRPDAGKPGWYFGAHTYDYDIDDYVAYDVDAILTHVSATAGTTGVAWVGHSMGGIVAYARAGTFHDARIERLVTVGSPGFMSPASKNLLVGYKARGALRLIPAVPAESASQVEAWTGLPLSARTVRDTLYADEDWTHDEYRLLLRYAVNDASPGELRQFSAALEDGEMKTRDGRVSYSKDIANVAVPALLFGGRRDALADPLVVRRVYDTLASADKSLVIAGRAEGFTVDYGHADMLVGENASREIFPTITRWLTEHDGP